MIRFNKKQIIHDLAVVMCMSFAGSVEHDGTKLPDEERNKLAFVAFWTLIEDLGISPQKVFTEQLDHFTDMKDITNGANQDN